MRPFPVIRNFKYYFWHKLLPAIIIVISGVLFLNFFLAYRLENYLKKEIRERIALATDNFYTLTFDDLNIHLVSGELSIEGIHLAPDTNTFRDWQAKDSLPLNYIKSDIQRIEFKGINLIWLKNYRKLNFKSFNIDNPTIEIVDAFYSDRHERRIRTTRSKTLHEFIEPYIDILSVNKFNIDDASVSFLAEDPWSPIHYTLEKFDFQGYNFQLDSSSYSNGKLLYMDHFEFYTEMPQVLIENNNFLLETDSIRLSTIDSLLLLKNIRFIPHEKFWTKTQKVPESFQSGAIELLQVDGLDFKRYNAENYLTSNNLKIISADLQVHSFSSGTRKKNQSQPESFLPSLSLYKLISPLLKKLTIDQITMEDASLDYLSFNGDTTEQVRIADLDFRAWKLLIDSTENKMLPFPYIQDVQIKAKGIDATLPDQNQKFLIDTLHFDSRQGALFTGEILLAPINKQSKTGYSAGTVHAVSIEGLKYDQDITLDRFILSSPDIMMYSSYKKVSKTEEKGTFLFDYLRQFIAREVWINDANFKFINRSKSPLEVFQLKNTSLYGKDFLLDEHTVNDNSWLPFNLGEYSFRFSEFDNSLAGNYRLRIKKADYNSKTDQMLVHTINLEPLNTDNSYISFHSPSVRMNGIKDLLKEPEIFSIDSLHVESPNLTINQQTQAVADSIDTQIKEHTPFNPFQHFSINHVSLNNTQIEMDNQKKKQQLIAQYDLLEIKQLNWNSDNKRDLHLENLSIFNPDVLWSSSNDNTSSSPISESKTLPEILHPFAESFIIDQLNISGIHIKTQQPYLNADIPVKNFHVDSLKWAFNETNRYLQANLIQIEKPDLSIERSVITDKPEKEVNDTIKKDIYSQLRLLGDEIRIKELDITEAEIDYTMKNNLPEDYNQKLNQTGFNLEDLVLNTKEKKFSFEDVNFHTQNLSIPIDNGFYDLKMNEITLSGQTLIIDSFHMVSPLPKTEFAKIHPKHKDWFDVTVERLSIEGLDIDKTISENLFYAKQITVDNPVLLNYKNKQIYTPPKFMPMIYEGLQKAPVKIDIERIDVNNFGVVYEELSPKAKRPGRLEFTELNGTLTGFTNIVSYPEQYMKLKADGKFYGQGHFNAIWLLPVDSLNDRFILEGHLPDMDLTLINEMIIPLASARLRSGNLNDFTFRMDAGIISGTIDMLFLYDSLQADIFKEENGTIKSKKFLNFLVNAVVRDNNPNKPGKEPRQPSVSIIRDPYHSSFNYLWQLLRPALTESVGITKTQQKIAGGAIGFITKVKKLFSKKSTKKKQQEKISGSLGKK